MAASTSGAVKAYLEGPTAMGGAQIGVPVYRDQAPANAQLPYLVVSEAQTIVPDTLEDGVASTVREHITVDVWMAWKNLTTAPINNVAPGGVLESYALPGAVGRALQGSRLLGSGNGAPPTTVYAALVHNIGPRIVAQDENVVHVPMWVEILRNL